MTLPSFNKQIDFGAVKKSKDSDTPLQIFDSTTNFSVLIRNVILPETTRYAHQNGEVFETSEEEIKSFCGISIIMGYNKLPKMRQYWSTESDLNNTAISNTMPRQRFEDIRRNLHFCNNEDPRPPRDDPEFDRGYKVRSVINYFNDAAQSALEPEEYLSIDEHMTIDGT